MVLGIVGVRGAEFYFCTVLLVMLSLLTDYVSSGRPISGRRAIALCVSTGVKRASKLANAVRSYVLMGRGNSSA